MTFPAKLTRETRLLADSLVAVPIGGQISYRELTALVGVDVPRRARHCLYAARQLALNESGAVFDTERGKGLRRLVAEEIPHLGSSARKHIRLSVRRTRQTMSKAMENFNDVDPVVRRQQLAEAAVLGLVEILARDRTVQKMERRSDPLPVADTARVLLRLIGAG